MEAIQQKAFALLQRSAVVTVATVDGDGFPRPVPVVKVKAEEPFTIWFATGTGSDKVAHLRKNPRAGISFFEHGDSVALTGLAEAVDDPSVKKALWQDWFIEHFPQGVDDPEYCLVCFRARKGVFYIEGEFVKSTLE